MISTTKTRMIGAAALVSLVAGALLMIEPAWAEGYVGDIRSARVDHGANPGDWPAGSEERERTRRRHADRQGERRSDRVYLLTPSAAVDAETVTAHGVAGAASAGVEERIGRDAVSDRQYAYALGVAKRRWRERVAELYGEGYAQWARAHEKRIQCTPIDGELECEVSAVPGR